MYQGDIRINKTLDFKFTTVDTTGVPTTLSGSPVVSVYVANGTVQLTAGITLTTNFDSVVGLNHLRIVATTTNGYGTQTDNQAVITTGTAGGASMVGYVPGHFSIENRSALMPLNADRTISLETTGAVSQVILVSSVVEVGNVVGTVALLGAGAIAANSFQTNSITSTAFSSAAAIEIATEVWASTSRTVQTVTTVTGSVGSVVGLNAALVDTTISSRLAPTIAARTLDVTTTGAAGIDWGNVENPNSTVALNGTFIAAIGEVLGDVAGSVLTDVIGNIHGDVQGDVQGNVDGSVGSVGSGGISNTSFAASAIDAAALAQSAGQEIADEVLNRNIAGGGSGNTRNVRNALRRLRNRVKVAALSTIYEEDDTTPAWEAVTTTAAGNPVTEVDPT